MKLWHSVPGVLDQILLEESCPLMQMLAHSHRISEAWIRLWILTCGKHDKSYKHVLAMNLVPLEVLLTRMSQDAKLT